METVSDPAGKLTQAKGSFGEGASEQGLHKAREISPRRRPPSFSVVSSHLQTLKRIQRGLQQQVHGYVYTAELRDQWREVRAILGAAPDPAEEPDSWYEFFNGLSVQLEAARRTASRLVATEVLPEELARLEQTLDRAIAAAEREVDEDEDSRRAGLASLNRAVGDLGDSLAAVGKECTEGAERRVAQLHKLVEDIFKRARKNDDIPPEEEKGGKRDLGRLPTAPAAESNDQGDSAVPAPTRPDEARRDIFGKIQRR